MRTLPPATRETLGALAFSILALTSPARAQAVAAATSPGETVTLDPFTVSSEKDVGFVAASSLAGGRMKTDLADTPVAYTVQTKEFLDALNLTDLQEALEWSPSTSHYVADNAAGMALGEDPTYTTRGISANPPQRNFFNGAYNFDTYNVERFDYTRGPNSILFGPGTISGAANVMSKFARPRHNHTEATLRLDGFGSARAALDANRTLGARQAVRLNVVNDNRKTWRDREQIRSKGAALAYTVNLTRTTQLKAAGEYDERSQVRAINELSDLFSAWSGVTYDQLVSLSAPSTVTKTFSSLGVGRLGSASAPEYWMLSPDRTAILNYAGSMQTEGYSTAGQRPLDGKLAVTGSLNLRVAPLLDAGGLPVSREALYGFAVAHSHFVMPTRQTTNLTTAPISRDRYKDATLILSQTLGDSIFLELAGDVNERKNYGNGSYFDSSALAGIGHVMIDINRNLPTGQPNPHFLDAYQQAEMDRRYNTTKNRALRASIAYVKNFKWVDLKANTMVGAERQTSLTTRENGILPIDPDPRQWARNGPQTRKLRYRIYFNDPVRADPPMEVPLPYLNPQNGQQGTITPVWSLMTYRSEGGVIEQTKNTDYWQGAAQTSWWHGRVTLLGGFRVDKLTTGQRMGLDSLAYPVGFAPDAAHYLWRPAAPADWRTLTYYPKNAAGVITGPVSPASSRPVDGTTGLPLAQYANDRFQDDFSPPSKSTKATTKSVGGLVKLYRGLSVFANFAQTFNPGDISRFTINFDTPKPSSSNGVDVGLRYAIADGRLNLSVSRFQSKEKDFTTGNPPGYSGFNTVITANPTGDDNPSGTNKRGLNQRPDLWFDVSDRESKGYEFEVTANPTRQWRVMANYATSDATQTNAYRETKAWLDQNNTVLHQILADAGVVFDGAGQAVVPADAAHSIDAIAAASSWNSIMANRANWVSGTQVLLHNIKYTANAFTDYTLGSGRLKGLSVGGGAQFRGPQAIGYRGADTIPDPTNPAKAIDDPSVDAYTVIWNRSHALATARLGYRWAIRRGQTLSLNLTVTNLFNYDRPNYTSAALRPYQGDLSSIARTMEYFRYTYIQPRTYTLSARYDF